MSDEFLGDRRKALEDSFFAKRDRELLQELQQKVALQSQKEALSAASGISDESVVDELLAHGIRAETLTALSLVPLVVVAWADGTVDVKERHAVLAAAEDTGLSEGTPSHRLLEQWLQVRPGPDLMEAWKDYIRALSGKLEAHAKTALKDDLLGRAREVAESAGGFLGIGKISKAEQEVLAELEQAFS